MIALHREMLCAWCLLLVSSTMAWAAPAGQSSSAFDTKRSAIFRGRVAKASELYSTVVLVNEDPNNASGSSAFCTGTLIAPRIVLTAAHCFIEEQNGQIVNRTPAAKIRVYAGHLNSNDQPFADAVVVSKLNGHPSYPNNSVDKDDLGIGREDDIGVLILAKPITNIPVAPILTAAQFEQEMKDGTQIIVNGYGNTDPGKEDGGVLHVGEMPFRQALEFEFWGGGSSNTDTCPGDSGGPGYVKIGGTLYLAGVGLRGIDRGEAKCGEGAIFARAHIYLDWIQANSDGLYDPNAAAAPKQGCGCSSQGRSVPPRLPLSGLLLLGFLCWRVRRQRSAA